MRGSIAARRFVKPSDAVRDVIATIDSRELEIVLFVDEGSRLPGTVSDADARRALPRGVTLDAGPARYRSPHVASDRTPRCCVLMKPSTRYRER